MIASSGGVRTAGGGQNFAMATVFDSISKPVIVSEPTAPKHRKSSIYLWFVSFQKTDCWDAKKLNRLHVAILAILVTIYVCHIISSPYIRFIQDDDTIVTIRVIQALCLVGGVEGGSSGSVEWDGGQRRCVCVCVSVCMVVCSYDGDDMSM